MNLLPGLPLIESPLFESIIQQMDLTEDEAPIARSLHEKVYAVINFPDAQIDDRIQRIKNNLAPMFPVDFEDPQSCKAGDFRIQDAWKTNDDVRAIAANQVVLDLLSKLYGRRAFPFQTLNFPVGTQQGAHADTAHFSSLPERFMCGVWLAMEDIGADAGPLFYYPGSHRWPIVTNGLIGRTGYDSRLTSAQQPYEAAWQAFCSASGVQPESLLARKGQALIWCANLLHGGSRQNDVRLTRWSQVTHYYFDDCIYYTPAYSDEAVGKLRLRRPVSACDGLPRSSVYQGAAVRIRGDGAKWIKSLKSVARFREKIRRQLSSPPRADRGAS